MSNHPTSTSTASSVNSPIVIQRPSHVVVHPLVLLFIVDHYRRAAMNTKKRVVGVLLGNWNGQTVNITNSYAGKLNNQTFSINI